MKKILIIEDDSSIAELERDYMEINGFSVDIESAGDTGLRTALSADYDLIILDLMLPKTDGFEICRQLRTVKDIPILMVSARKEDIDKIRGLGLGADDYIIKPFSPGELVARVKAHLARYERLRGNTTPKNDEISIRGLHIDKTSHRVYINNAEVNLTAKEFDLLVLLGSNPNRVFSKTELFERIWGLESLGDIATVTVHIGKLREKIELVPSNPQYIETIWGVGYRFKM
jgi:DNA-binding response OmpR family regulator